MKNSFLLLSAIISLFLPISGCVKNIDYGNSVEDNIQFSGTINRTPQKDVFVKGNSLSGFNMSGYYNNILISGEKIIYGSLFDINVSNKINRRSYYRTYNKETDIYIDKLILSDLNAKNNLSIEAYKTSLSLDNLCGYNTENGGNLISKEIKDIGGINVYFLNMSFLISSPDTESWASNESSICFIKDDVVYKILVSSDIKFMNEIVNSFKFIK